MPTARKVLYGGVSEPAMSQLSLRDTRSDQILLCATEDNVDRWPATDRPTMTDQTARMRKLQWVDAELWTAMSENVPCTPSEFSEHLRSLIRIFTMRILDSQCKLSSCVLRRFLSDCANAQADLTLRLAHISKDVSSCCGPYIGRIPFLRMQHTAVITMRERIHEQNNKTTHWTNREWSPASSSHKGTQRANNNRANTLERMVV